MSKVLFASSNDTKEDGYFNIYELYNTKLDNVELITLSAARNVNTDLHQGEGNLHMAKGLNYAGCPSLLTSLWRAEDDAAKDIMLTFYKHLQKGKNVTTALRIGQQEFPTNTNPFKAHPYFWAGFLVIGDPTPVSGGSFSWWIFCLLLVAAFVGFYVWRTIA